MQIRRISFQGGKTEQDLYSEDYARHFAELSKNGGSEHFRKSVRMMIDLIVHLEALEGLPVWVCTSLTNLVFYTSDVENYGDNGNKGKAAVRTNAPHYEVMFTDSTGRTRWYKKVDKEDATKMIIAALRMQQEA